MLWKCCSNNKNKQKYSDVETISLCVQECNNTNFLQKK